jgi:non-specific serine/threonine protein kinase
MTSRAIAERLFLSERTVESHLEHILTKLGFSSRAQVAGWVAEHPRGANGDV